MHNHIYRQILTKLVCRIIADLDGVLANMGFSTVMYDGANIG